MNKTTPIDVTPVEHVSERTAHKQASGTDEPRYYTYDESTPGKASSGGSRATTYRAPRYGTANPKPQQQAKTQGQGQANTSRRVGGVVQAVAGGAIALVGVPLLVLPGPGLLAIGGGAALAASGIKKALGK